MSDHIFVVDGNWYLHRVFHTAKTSRPLSEVLPYAFTSLVCKDAVRVRATHLMVAFDGPKVFRHKVYDQYKAKRDEKKKPNEESDDVDSGSVYESLPAVRAYLAKAGMYWVQPQKYEADDVAVTVAKLWNERYPKGRTTIGGQDKDVYQCLTPRVSMYDSSHKPDPIFIRDTDAERKKGVKISQMIDYQTLTGDPTDDIPVLLTPGKAKATLKQYGNIQNWYKKGLPADRAWLQANKANIMRNRKLVRLVTNCIDLPKSVDLKVPKLPANDMFPETWHIYQSMLYPKTKGLFR